MKLNNLFLENEQNFYALKKYRYKGYTVELKMTSGLPRNPNIPDSAQGLISHSYWVIDNEDLLDFNIPKLPVELVKPDYIKELDSLIDREKTKRINQEAEYIQKMQQKSEPDFPPKSDPDNPELPDYGWDI